MIEGIVPPSPDLAARLAGTPLLVMLDVDGTLAPIAPRPELASVPEATRRAVAALARRPATHVALVSGRGALDAQRMITVPGAWVLGNHGMELVAPDGALAVEERVARWRDSLAGVADSLRASLETIGGAIVEDKQWTLSIHYRLVEPGEVPLVERAVRVQAESAGLVVTSGKQVIEVRPPVHVDKGTAVRDLAIRLGGAGRDASILYVGDDRTDEDAFKRLRAEQPRAVTMHVGMAELPDGTHTSAEFVVPDTEAVRTLLEWLVERPPS